MTRRTWAFTALITAAVLMLFLAAVDAALTSRCHRSGGVVVDVGAGWTCTTRSQP